MRDPLPRQLSTGVTATREGLVIEREGLLTVIGARSAELRGIPAICWQAAHELLSYRDGEPWCRAEWPGIYGGTEPLVEALHDEVLHRLAAILCDGAEEFRTLHWCIINLGGKS